MWWRLEDEIVDAANRRIRDFERRKKAMFDENARRMRRSAGIPTLLDGKRPEFWNWDPAFDPYHVRARAATISHAITAALREGRYEPRRPAGFYVKKPGGGSRLVATFPIADEVVSSRLYHSLLEKNRALLSARSYAYRADLSALDAIAHIKSEWQDAHRLFVAEFDFAEFFDRIAHDHIWRTVRSLGLIMKPLEARLIGAFLVAPTPYTGKSERSLPHVRRSRGVPQGTSVSLFLSNVAASPLDRSLERLGVGFVRYADDTLVWSRDYQGICAAANEIHSLAKAIGVEINESKSKGIRLLVSPTTQKAEMESTSEVVYLSHRIGLGSVGIKQSSIDQIKARMAAMIFNNLLREPLAGTQDLSRLGRLDRDYVVLIWQLRRLLYGRLTERDVGRLTRGPLLPVRLSGAIATYPLVEDIQSLRSIDSWLASQVWLALRKRARLLGSFPFAPIPWELSRTRLIDLKTTSARSGEEIDLRLPSVVRMANLARRSFRAHGARVIQGRDFLYGVE